MAQYLTKEHLNSEGEPNKKYHVATRKHPCKKKAKLDVNPEDKAESGDVRLLSESLLAIASQIVLRLIAYSPITRLQI
jgi:hypothetical protein